MTEEAKYGVIIQARNGSARLPGKMTIPYYKNQSILDLLLLNIQKGLPGIQIILATSNNSIDDDIAEKAMNTGTSLFRGDEKNVLIRMIKAAHKFGVENIVRVCADNPFLNIGSIAELIDLHQINQSDYLSFEVGAGRPAILSHFGFYAELVKKKALEEVAKKTDDPLYQEHVTNYIYTHPDQFEIAFINAPGYLYNREDIRLTVDTKEDFDLSKNLYKLMVKNNWNQEELINFIDSDNEIKVAMKKMISQNSK